MGLISMLWRSLTGGAGGARPTARAALDLGGLPEVKVAAPGGAGVPLTGRPNLDLGLVDSPEKLLAGKTLQLPPGGKLTFRVLETRHHRMSSEVGCWTDGALTMTSRGVGRVKVTPDMLERFRSLKTAEHIARRAHGASSEASDQLVNEARLTEYTLTVAPDANYRSAPLVTFFKGDSEDFSFNFYITPLDGFDR